MGHESAKIADRVGTAAVRAAFVRLAEDQLCGLLCGVEPAPASLLVSIECVVKGEGITRGRSVAKGVGRALTRRLRHLTVDVVRSGTLIVEVYLVDAERLVANMEGCCAHSGLPDIAVDVSNRYLHQTLVGLGVGYRSGLA